MLPLNSFSELHGNVQLERERCRKLVACIIYAFYSATNYRFVDVYLNWYTWTDIAVFTRSHIPDAPIIICGSTLRTAFQFL